ncbi:pancreatic triacylglycerol lipase-like [Ostrinia furnacalis]|uniref:pancreatic triacylglycerol lipase-like n=1 Tax=Ostrinia furnacalis TaxID=93504 RepID=UPI0010394925|nr:pancreatic triacylglycerol lipase-like [Ostrinia furnacalis]
MKAFVVFAALAALCAAKSLPLTPEDSSDYVEGESRYVWMPDGEGNPVLVDLKEPVDESLLSSRNGANNQYWLFTRQNPTARQVLVHNNINSVWNSNYRNTRGLVVIVHGWNNNGDTQMNPLIRDAFLAVADVNVIVVDWRALAGSSYNTAAAGVPSVGQHLGNFLIWLFNNVGGNWNNVHLVGFSLGAHVVGNAGRQAGGRISRVTGLDPAGPLWGGNGNRLQPNAGRYVEAIHTDGRALGLMDVSGHADFYPNGGRHPQPGCWGGVTQTSCSHGRATELFASSVRTNHFVGRRCVNLWEAELNTCNGAALNMGNPNINKSGTGIYGLRTGSAWPF